MAAKAISKRASTGVAGRGPRRASAGILDLVRTCRQQAAIAGRYWDKAEAALEQLVAKLGAGKIVGVDDGVYARLVDLFAESNSVYVPKVMKRYKLVICDASGKEIRLRDRQQRTGRAKKKRAGRQKRIV
jgi:hypothetical protein